MKNCTQIGCPYPVLARFTWPGQREAHACPLHARKLLQIAAAIGLDLEIIALTVDELIADMSPEPVPAPFLYILEDRKVVPAPTVEAWGLYLNCGECAVRRSTIRDGVQVKTSFIGIDRRTVSADDEKASSPLVFEAMIFGGPLNHERDFCATWQEAEELHSEMVARALAASSPS
jgi:hypothetical protein